MTAESIIRRLGGRGKMALCPAHEDRSPSLSVEDRNGKILVRCFGGCGQKAVIEALHGRGLWPYPERRDWTPAERRIWIRQKREQSEAEAWGRTATALAETVLEEMVYQSERADMGRLLAIVRRGGAEMICEYKAWRESEPKLTAAMERAGRASDQRQRLALAAFLAECGDENVVAA